MVQLANSFIWLAEPVNHFFVAFIAGFLALSLISIILSALYKKASRSGQSNPSTAVRYGIALSSLLLVVSVSLLSHWALDAFTVWANTPLAPHLTIIK